MVFKPLPVSVSPQTALFGQFGVDLQRHSITIGKGLQALFEDGWNPLSPMSRRGPRDPQSWKSATFSACSVSSRLRFTMCWVRALSLDASLSRPSRFST